MSVQQIFVHGVSGSGVNVSAVRGLSLSLANAADSPEMPTAGDMRNWKVVLATAPGVGNSRTFTLQKNNANTALAITISGTATEGTDPTNSVSYTAGDTIRIALTVSGTPAAADFRSVMEFVPTTAGENIHEFASELILSSPDNGVISGTSSEPAGTYGTRHTVSSPGTVTAMRCVTRTNATGGGSFKYSLVLNGVKQDGTGGTTNTTVTINSGTRSGNSTFSLAVAAGDLLSVQYGPATSTTGSTWDTGMIVFVPTTADQGMIASVTTATAPSNTGTRYSYPRSNCNATGDSWSATESARSYPGPLLATIYVTAMYAETSAVPAAGKSYTFTLRKNGAPTAATVTISSTGATGNITGLGIPITPTDTWSIESTPSGTPASMFPRISLLIGTPDGLSASGGRAVLLVSP